MNILNKNEIQKEKEEFEQKLSEFNKFINSNKFIKIDGKQQNLFYQQFDAMSKYHSVLEQRLKLL